MGSTTAIGVPYPVATDTPDVPRDVKAVADWLTANLPGKSAYAVSAGQISVNGTSVIAGGNVQTAVTFPASRFTVAPRVQTAMTAAPSGSANLTTRASSITASGFTSWVNNVGAATTTWTGLTVDWWAEQMTASAASG